MSKTLSSIFKKISLSILFTLSILISNKTFAQAEKDSTFWVGTHHGMMIANMNFNPLISFSSIQSYSGGIDFLLMNEKNIGISAEFNYLIGGWLEDSLYQKNFTLLQIPLLTQFQIGKKKFKAIIQVGPNISFLLNESSTFVNIPPDSVLYNYYSTLIENSVFTGVTAGFGFRFFHKSNHSISIEGRFNQGLSGIFKQNGNTEFVLSQPQFMGGYLKYQIRLSKRTKKSEDDSVQRDGED